LNTSIKINQDAEKLYEAILQDTQNNPLFQQKPLTNSLGLTLPTDYKQQLISYRRFKTDCVYGATFYPVRRIFKLNECN
jgi:hypothetical protein